MKEFLELTKPDIALSQFLSHIKISESKEFIPTFSALGRVIAKDIYSPTPLPEFSRSTVDGFAVIAQSTFGASMSLPAYLEIVGEILMGKAPNNKINHTSCMKIHTGGMLPVGADAVVMLEQTQLISENEIEIVGAVAPGENTIQIGEDVGTNDVVVLKGKHIRPAEIGGLMALGIVDIPVIRRPLVGIISTGDELIPPSYKTAPGQVRDINSYSLSSLVIDAGGTPKFYGIVPDNFQQLRDVAGKAHKECEFVIITAGSSASSRDYTSRVINDLGSPGVLIHGINIKPGKPTILGNCGGVPFIGLPGNPVSAYVIAQLFVVPAIKKYLGSGNYSHLVIITANISTNINSVAGREDWIPVRIINHDYEKALVVVEPIFGRSNFIFNLVKADGLLRIPVDSTGVSAGESVHIHLFA